MDFDSYSNNWISSDELNKYEKSLIWLYIKLDIYSSIALYLF